MNHEGTARHFLMSKQMPPTTNTALSGCPICLSLEQKTISRHEEKELKQCLHCRASFVFPQPSLGVVEAYFEGSAELNDLELEKKFERNRERVLSQVAKQIKNRKQGGIILDVGCATGFFLGQYFRKPEWQALGVELSRHLAEKAAANGIDVHCGSIHTARLATNSIDVISVIDAFYYFPKPKIELAEFHRVLGSGAVLMLELPLSVSRIWRTSTRLGRLLSGVRQPLLESSDHLYYYSPKSIAFLLANSGFRVEALLPLPGNDQGQTVQNLIYKTYELISRALYIVSLSKILLTPRFLVIARKKT